jgi:hypothetical protein
MHTQLWWGNLKESSHLEDIDTRIILNDLKAIGWEGMDWIDLP